MKDFSKNTDRMTPGENRFSDGKAFALISTLLIIAVLTIMVVAFMQSMRIDRLTARSYLDKYRADLAVDAGKADAVLLLQRGGLTNDYFSVLQTNYSTNTTSRPPYYFIAVPTQAASNSQVKYVPLVSGSSTNTTNLTKNMGLFPAQADIFDGANTNRSTNEPRLPDFVKKYYGDQNPESRWVNITNGSGEAVARYCYWIEDLQGRLDVREIGNTNASGAQLRGDNFGDPKQIAFFTLFNKSLSVDNGGTIAKTVISNQSRIPTSASMKQFITTIDSSLGGTNASDPLLHLYAGLGYEDEPEVIPYGYGYVNAGQSKIALNTVITSSNAVATLTNAIETNLPNFASDRRGGMSKVNYLNTLAASIIDYADADTLPTTDGSSYRGLDSYPLLTQWFMMTAYTSKSPATFVNRHFIEIWNMSDKTISGKVRFVPVNGYTAAVGGSTLNFTSPGPGVTVVNGMVDANVSLGPNQKMVADMGSITFMVTPSTIPSDSIAVGANVLADYTMYWQQSSTGPFVVVDRAGGKVYGVGKSFSYSPGAPPNSNSDWNASIAGLNYRTVGGGTFLNGHPGDPRAAYYIQAPQDQNSYDQRAVVGGRTIRAGLTANTYGEVRPSYWADPGLDDTPGNQIGDVNKTPTSVTAALNNTNNAMVHYGNYSDSKYRSVTELGNVYDPSQWAQYTGTDWAGAQTALADITTATPADANYGGGYTLRIGRPEFSRFNSTNSYAARSRATDLLGIFSTETMRSTKGLLNLNTASRDALRTLGAGINLGKPAYINYTNASTLPATIYGPVSSNSPRVEADVFADAVIAARPFYSRHELAYKLKSSPTAPNFLGANSFWGNPVAWGVAAERPTRWRDAVAEEYLREIYDLVTVRSRNFRFYVTGQTLDKRGKVTATSRKIYDVYMQPVRNPATPTTINNISVKTIYEIAP